MRSFLLRGPVQRLSTRANGVQKEEKKKVPRCVLHLFRALVRQGEACTGARARFRRSGPFVKGCPVETCGSKSTPRSPSRLSLSWFYGCSRSPVTFFIASRRPRPFQRAPFPSLPLSLDGRIGSPSEIEEEGAPRCGAIGRAVGDVLVTWWCRCRVRVEQCVGEDR